MSRRLWSVMAAGAWVLTMTLTGLAQETLSEKEVFRDAFLSSDTLPRYMRAHAGHKVTGAGLLEATLPRAYFDSSVPDANPAIAIIHIEPGRKVTCGLPKPITREEMSIFTEGTPVAFAGELADAQDWGEWRTIYLGNCLLTLRDE